MPYNLELPVVSKQRNNEIMMFWIDYIYLRMNDVYTNWIEMMKKKIDFQKNLKRHWLKFHEIAKSTFKLKAESMS